jgi:hypothetical protein
MSIEENLIQLFGASKVSQVSKIDGEVSIVAVNLSETKRVQLLMTNGLSSHLMNVPEHLKYENRCEVYFCVPSYWDLLDDLKAEVNWVINWLELIVNYVKSNDSWLGAGHTLKCGADKLPLSPTMKQEYFVFSNPILMHDEFSEIKKFNAEVNFYSIIPLFEKEFEYKQRKGIEKFTQKMIASGISEKLDEFRPSLIKRSRLFF